jgi:hypothetical protein
LGLLALRVRYGAQDDGRTDQPLTPSALFESLLADIAKSGGDASLGSALAARRTELSAGLRTRGGKLPQVWLSLSDAASFTVVQSCFAIAGALRRDLSEQAKTNPRLSQAELTSLLLRVAEPESGKADKLLEALLGPDPLAAQGGQFSSTQDVDPATTDFRAIANRAVACELIRAVVVDMPPALWPQELGQQRQVLMGQLRAVTAALHAMLPAPPPLADTLEKRLRTVQNGRTNQEKK